jgi:AraC family transcriptional regulator, arabinose operon regulatory protein
MKKEASFFTINPQPYPASQINAGHWVTKPGYGTIRERGTQDWLLIYTISGAGQLAYPGGLYRTGPGDAALWPPGTYHDYRIGPQCEAWEIIWAHFLPWPHWLEFMDWPAQSNGFRLIQVDKASDRIDLKHILMRMCDLSAGPTPRYRLRALNALEDGFLRFAEYNPLAKESRIDSRIQKAMDLLCQNLPVSMPVNKLAHQCGLSGSRFAHLFVDELGMTVVEYREAQRMNKARQLLERSSFSIKEIAAMTGFESPFYFSRRFSLQNNRSPSEYRKSINQR